jgi:hypothetical protein
LCFHTKRRLLLLQVAPGEGAHAVFALRGWRQMAPTAYVTASQGRVVTDV